VDVALVPTAFSLPFLVLALPSGALGDIRDQGSMLIAGQFAMTLAGAGLALVAVTHVATPPLVLALMTGLGAGQALATPSWLALQRTLLPFDEIAPGAALDGVGGAVARAAGPAIGGLLVLLGGPSVAFLVNAALSLAVGVVLIRRCPRAPAATRTESIPAAIRAVTQYVRRTPVLRTVLIRGGVFSTFAGAPWALLPQIARHRLELGAAGYGALLGCAGLGAALAAAILPALHGRFGTRRVLAGAFLVAALGCADLGWTSGTVPAIGGLLLIGGAWVGVIALLDATAQTTISERMRARGLAVYETSLQGGVAVSGVVWGSVAAVGSARLALSLVAIGLLVSRLAWIRQ